jgi:hypothetical protein
MAVNFASAFAGGDAGDDNVRDLVLDGAGNTYLVGKFAGKVDFDPSLPGTYELTSSPPGSRTNYAAKYDASGKLVWAQQFGGDANEGSDRELAVDGAGNVYVVGSFTGSATFGSTTLTSAGMSDAFMTKLDASGNFIWAMKMGGANDDRGNGVAVDSSGNALIIADMSSTAGGSGARDVLIRKLDPNGNTIWSTTIGASSSIPAKGKPTPTGSAGGTNITVDSTGHVFATGYMNGTVDFNAASGTTAVSGLAFVMKLDSAGGLTWARAFTKGGSPTSNPQVTPSDLAVDASGTVYSTGSYLLSVDFNPGVQNSQKYFLNSGSRANYVSALDSSGNFLWAKSTQSASATTDIEAALAIDGLGGIYLAGSFNGTIDFDPGASTFALTSAGSDAYVWKLEASGNFVWAGQMGGSGNDFARALDVDGAGNIVVGGNFNGMGDFDPTTGTSILASAGGFDFFVVKLAQTSSLTATGYSSITSSESDYVLASTDEGAASANGTAMLGSGADLKKLRSRAASIDAALDNLDDGAWKELVVEF